MVFLMGHPIFKYPLSQLLNYQKKKKKKLLSYLDLFVRTNG